jgi:hypothetical protein
MKRALCLSTVVVMAMAAVASAQSMGTLTVNGASMEVKGVVAVLGDNPAATSVTIYLLSSAPTAAQIAKLQAGDRMWLVDPFGRYTLYWKEAVGSAKKATIIIQTDDLGMKGTGTVMFRTSGSEVDVSLTGTVKEGQEVTLTSKGSATPFSNTTLGWNVNVKAKVLPSKKT